MFEYKLSEILGKKRLKIKQVAKETGISYVTLCKIYNNKPVNITLKVVDRLLNYLNCSVTGLIDFIPN